MTPEPEEDRDEEGGRGEGDRSGMEKVLFTPGGTSLTVVLLPEEIRHLDQLREELRRGGGGEVSREQLIRFAVDLLSREDFIEWRGGEGESSRRAGGLPKG